MVNFPPGAGLGVGLVSAGVMLLLVPAAACAAVVEALAAGVDGFEVAAFEAAAFSANLAGVLLPAEDRRVRTGDFFLMTGFTTEAAAGAGAEALGLVAALRMLALDA